LDDTLASVLQNRPDDCEVLVVHGGVYDDPYGLRDEVRFLAGEATDDLVQLVNRGVRASQGEILHVMGCGMEVEDGWTTAAVSRFADPAVACVTPVVVERKRDGRILSAGVSRSLFGGRRLLVPGGKSVDLQRKLQPLGPVLTAGFYRRRALEVIGGFEPMVGTVHADFDAALSLAAAGYRNVLEIKSRLIGDVNLTMPCPAYRQGQGAERVFWRHAAARGALKAALLHPLEIAAEFAVGCARPGAVRRLIGRLVAAGEAPRHLRYRLKSPEPGAAPSSSRMKNVRFDGAHAEQRTLSTNPETAAR
jgi:hypothetical protein